jgi:hypothetical protein
MTRLQPIPSTASSFSTLAALRRYIKEVKIQYPGKVNLFRTYTRLFVDSFHINDASAIATLNNFHVRYPRLSFSAQDFADQFGILMPVVWSSFCRSYREDLRAPHDGSLSDNASQSDVFHSATSQSFDARSSTITQSNSTTRSEIAFLDDVAGCCTPSFLVSRYTPSDVVVVVRGGKDAVPVGNDDDVEGGNLGVA